MATTGRHAGKAYWVVVADEANATIYSREARTGPLQAWLTIDNTEGRKRTGDLIADRGGRSFDSVGQGRHTMAREKSSPKTQVAERFARQVAGHIGRLIHDGHCRGYVLVAPPRFLGQLRDAMAKISDVEPDKTIDKELVGRSVLELQEYIDN